jgi:hypothetical protein
LLRVYRDSFGYLYHFCFLTESSDSPNLKRLVLLHLAFDRPAKIRIGAQILDGNPRVATQIGQRLSQRAEMTPYHLDVRFAAHHRVFIRAVRRAARILASCGT